MCTAYHQRCSHGFSYGSFSLFTLTAPTFGTLLLIWYVCMALMEWIRVFCFSSLFAVWVQVLSSGHTDRRVGVQSVFSDVATDDG